MWLCQGFCTQSLKPQETKPKMETLKASARRREQWADGTTRLGRKYFETQVRELVNLYTVWGIPIAHWKDRPMAHQSTHQAPDRLACFVLWGQGMEPRASHTAARCFPTELYPKFLFVCFILFLKWSLINLSRLTSNSLCNPGLFQLSHPPAS